MEVNKYISYVYSFVLLWNHASEQWEIKLNFTGDKKKFLNARRNYKFEQKNI
jgi:hypothetical protein